jgi:hypothetical protein
MTNRGAWALVFWRVRGQWPSVALLLVALIAASGCGSGGGGGATAESAASRSGSTNSSTSGGDVSGTVDSARAAGRRACRGADPLEIAQRYERAAVAAGASKKFAALAADPTTAMRSSAGYPRLAAAIYAGTLPGPQRARAAAGCAEELASR